MLIIFYATIFLINVNLDISVYAYETIFLAGSQEVRSERWTNNTNISIEWN